MWFSLAIFVCFLVVCSVQQNQPSFANKTPLGGRGELLKVDGMTCWINGGNLQPGLVASWKDLWVQADFFARNHSLFFFRTRRDSNCDFSQTSIEEMPFAIPDILAGHTVVRFSKSRIGLSDIAPFSASAVVDGVLQPFTIFLVIKYWGGGSAS